MIVLEGVAVLKDLIDCVYKRSECNEFGKRFLFEVIHRKSQTVEMNLIQGIIDIRDISTLALFLLSEYFRLQERRNKT